MPKDIYLSTQRYASRACDHDALDHDPRLRDRQAGLQSYFTPLSGFCVLEVLGRRCRQMTCERTVIWMHFLAICEVA